MLAYSIEHALASKYINRVIVSTDSQQYADIAKAYGAEVPFLRPMEYAQDHSLDFDVFYHAVQYLKQVEDYHADILVQLRPTYPIRDVADIDTMIEMLLEDKRADSVRTIAPAKEIPYKMWFKSDFGQIAPVMTEITECYNMPRQQLPKVYYQNACIDVVRTKVLMEQHSMTGKYILGYEMPNNYDIDTEEEYLLAETYLKILKGGNRFVFDIDGVIATLEENNNYINAKPNILMIDIVNSLHKMGNEIILLTARGYVTGMDWTEITKRQMKEWHVCYDELHFGKPNADYYIDDKMVSIEQLLKVFQKNVRGL